MQKICKFASILMLTACTLGPDYERPQFWSDEKLKNNLSLGDKSYVVNKKWYEIFVDDELNLLVEEAVANNLDVKIAVSRLRQARHNFNINRVNYFPMLNVDGEYNYAYAPHYNEFGNDSSYFHVGLDAAWEIDIWGGGRRQAESYDALYKAAAANVDNVLLSVTAEVVNDYILLRTTQNRLSIARRNLAVQKDILQVVQKKYKAGLAEENDLNQAEFAVQSTKALLPDLEASESVYQNAISILQGKLPNDIVNKTSSNVVTGVFDFNVNNLKNFPLEVVRNRPDVREAEEMLKSKNANIGVSIAAMFPNVSLSAVLGRQSHKIDGLNYAQNAIYTYNPVVNMPFLHWGQLLNEVELSKAIKDEYLYDYEMIMLTAIEEIKNAMKAIEKEYDKNKALRIAVQNMKKVLESMKIKYKAGLIEFSDLLSSEQNLLNAEDALANSNGAICQNIVSFYKAIGGGYY